MGERLYGLADGGPVKSTVPMTGANKRNHTGQSITHSYCRAIPSPQHTNESRVLHDPPFSYGNQKS